MGGVAPWAISLITPRYGWVEGRPGFWNLVGLIPVALGWAMIVWVVSLHFVRSTGVLEFERTPRQILVKGPYRFSRNPEYLLELVMWLGWVVFYGSIAIFVALVMWWIAFVFILVPYEERQLEARFGETFLNYKNVVPKWFGLTLR